MKYYSEVTNTLYESVEELEKAEQERANKTKARKVDAEKVDQAYKTMVEARKAYENELAEFCKKHGAFHKSINEPDTWFDILDLFKNI